MKGRTVELPKLAYSPMEAAKALGLGKTMVYELCAQGQLKHARVGESSKRILIPVAECERWLQEQVTKQTAERRYGA